MKQENITILSVSDNKLAVMLAALLKSVSDNHHSGEHIDYHIVSTGISRRNITRLEKSVDPDKITIIWHQNRDVIPQGFNFPLDNTIYPITVFTRLFAPHFIPEKVKRLLYLDVDMIVRKDISALWYTDLQGKHIAAVQDPMESFGGRQWAAVKNFRELGYPHETPYFNSGLLIMELDFWRKTNVTDQVFEVVRKNLEHITYADQYGLNIVFVNNWHKLDHRWNVYATEEMDDPWLIHFIMVKPIYEHYYFSKKYASEFFAYLEKTPWKGFTPRSRLRAFIEKVKLKLWKKVKKITG
ncbi:glycosyltransferase family 8 protein [Pedobacter yulinensis]|uniref:Glycosyltransferase family 8 protein n=1 Tax=Pedobacter yulinensis TaxID=2126353 RepID=A0A2T3HLQ2_9SPHI|nr:glycosyltransferase family 8 protein [Pedobacter yulinensis]PST83372.1 glycosyltransferase family 8 protein [Pedobacter yulinensis]